MKTKTRVILLSTAVVVLYFVALLSCKIKQRIDLLNLLKPADIHNLSVIYFEKSHFEKDWWMAWKCTLPKDEIYSLLRSAQPLYDEYERQNLIANLSFAFHSKLDAEALHGFIRIGSNPNNPRVRILCNENSSEIFIWVDSL